MIFTIWLVIFLSISSVRNNQIDSSESDSEEVRPAPDPEPTRLSNKLMASCKEKSPTIYELYENEELPSPRIVIVGPTGSGKIIKLRQVFL